jgi:methionyl-tRNA formyltransferase
LTSRLAEIGAPLLAETLVLAHGGRAPRRPQDRKAGCYARKLDKADGAVSWDHDAVTVWNRQRAVTPWPGATTSFRNRNLLLVRAQPEHLVPLDVAPGTVVEIGNDGLVVACAPGALRLGVVRPEGRGDQAAADWARGARVEVGDRLTLEKEAHA